MENTIIDASTHKNKKYIYVALFVVFMIFVVLYAKYFQIKQNQNSGGLTKEQEAQILKDLSDSNKQFSVTKTQQNEILKDLSSSKTTITQEQESKILESLKNENK